MLVFVQCHLVNFSTEGNLACKLCVRVCGCVCVCIAHSQTSNNTLTCIHTHTHTLFLYSTHTHHVSCDCRAVLFSEGKRKMQRCRYNCCLAAIPVLVKDVSSVIIFQNSVKSDINTCLLVPLSKPSFQIKDLSLKTISNLRIYRKNPQQKQIFSPLVEGCALKGQPKRLQTS